MSGIEGQNLQAGEQVRKRVATVLCFIGCHAENFNRETVQQNCVKVHVEHVNQGRMQPDNLR